MVVELSKKYLFQVIIIVILILVDKSIISLNHKDLILCPVYITIKNLNVKTWQFQKEQKVLFLSSISILYKWSKFINNRNKDFKPRFII